jgi:hypothetical protein
MISCRPHYLPREFSSVFFVAVYIPPQTDAGTKTNWVLDFLTDRPQVVKVGINISTSLTLNTGAPQRCVLSPLLYSLFTHDCVAMHNSNSIIKFAYDKRAVGLINNKDEKAYREEVRALGVWCQENNLTLNVNKTKEMMVDFRK